VRLRHSALLLVVMIGCQAAGHTSDPHGAAPSRAQIQAAVAKLRLDPNLSGESKFRTLRWSGNSSSPPPSDPPSWLTGLFEFLGQTSSFLLWVAGTIAVAIAAIWVIRTLKARSPSRQVQHPQGAVSHVRQLDIRPDSLPGDVGAAALALLDAGHTRDALSLLYRGALSRAVHRYGVLIGESFTEGEALKAARGRLDPSRNAYFAELVGLWQRAVYAGETTAHDSIARLCGAFSPTLDGAFP